MVIQVAHGALAVAACLRLRCWTRPLMPSRVPLLTRAPAPSEHIVQMLLEWVLATPAIPSGRLPHPLWPHASSSHLLPGEISSHQFPEIVAIPIKHPPKK